MHRHFVLQSPFNQDTAIPRDLSHLLDEEDRGHKGHERAGDADGHCKARTGARGEVGNDGMRTGGVVVAGKGPMCGHKTVRLARGSPFLANVRSPPWETTTVLILHVNESGPNTQTLTCAFEGGGQGGRFPPQGRV